MINPQVARSLAGAAPRPDPVGRVLAKADRSEGRRDAWLRLLDTLGLGFDS